MILIKNLKKQINNFSIKLIKLIKKQNIER